MTKTILALSLLFSLPLFAASPSADYNITIHVSESRIGTDCGSVIKGDSFCKSVQKLSVMIDGAKYELEAETRTSQRHRRDRRLQGEAGQGPTEAHA